MKQYFVIKSGSKPIKARFEGEWSVITNGDGTVTLQLDFLNENNLKKIDILIPYFEGDEDGKE